MEAGDLNHVNSVADAAPSGRGTWDWDWDLCRPASGSSAEIPLRVEDFFRW